MSRYRSEEDVLRARIVELEEQIERARSEKTRLEGAVNQGPEARRPFSRAMYHAGRALGRLFRGRSASSARGVDALRAHVASLEERLGELDSALANARRAAEAAAFAEAESRLAQARSGARSEARPADPPTAPSPARSLGRALGRAIRRIRG